LTNPIVLAKKNRFANLIVFNKLHKCSIFSKLVTRNDIFILTIVSKKLRSKITIKAIGGLGTI
jgi:hypothetical protein